MLKLLGILMMNNKNFDNLNSCSWSIEPLLKAKKKLREPRPKPTKEDIEDRKFEEEFSTLIMPDKNLPMGD